MIDEIKFYVVSAFYSAAVIAMALVLAYAGFGEAVLFAIK